MVGSLSMVAFYFIRFNGFKFQKSRIFTLNMNLLDSGCVANDTSSLAFLEAINLYKDQYQLNKDSFYELSIGTGQADSSYNSKWWGLSQWLPFISYALMDLNSKNQEYLLSI